MDLGWGVASAISQGACFLLGWTKMKAMRCRAGRGAAQEQGIGNANALNTFIIGSFAAAADLLSFCSRGGWVLELFIDR